ncbi:MAG: flavodoxin domain-containing protein, partial [Candidatus Omnitrophica bacterium]|nr:flavodoxin domain-containing protein [Candidatus Omnitrophota bacterium]
MAKVLVAYYSSTGNTAKMARFVAEGLEKENLEVAVKKLEDIKPKELLEYQGIIIGSPTYYGTMAYQVKKLLDESVEFHGSLEGKVGAAFSS